MKLIILCLNTVNKPSPMSEGVVEIRINNQPCKGINLTTWHTQAQRPPRVATIHNVTKKPGRVLPRPSVVFHVYASVDTPWVAQTLSRYTSMKWGKVSSTPRHTKLLSLGISYVPYAPVHFKCLFNGAQPTRALIDTSGGYHLEAPNIRSYQYPPFSPNCLAWSPIIPTIWPFC
jgi:hypothetical protein